MQACNGAGAAISQPPPLPAGNEALDLTGVWFRSCFCFYCKQMAVGYSCFRQEESPGSQRCLVAHSSSDSRRERVLSPTQTHKHILFVVNNMLGWFAGSTPASCFLRIQCIGQRETLCVQVDGSRALPANLQHLLAAPQMQHHICCATFPSTTGWQLAAGTAAQRVTHILRMCKFVLIHSFRCWLRHTNTPWRKVTGIAMPFISCTC